MSGPDSPAGEANRASTALLASAVVLAFADASIVTLALPAIYGEHDTSIVGVSWVITAYAAAVAATAGCVLAAARRGPPAVPLTAAGLALFAAASAACALAPTLGWLVAGRCVQGLGAALLLVGSMDVLRALHPAGRRIWASAGTVGLALGPALGGALTEWFEWRAIFAVQAPVAAVALLAAFDRHARAAPPGPAVPAPASPPGRGRLGVATVGLLLVSGALVGALFLAVLLVIEVWRFSPLSGAVVVSALPAAAVAARFLRPSGAAGRVAGPFLLAAGLLALALLPSTGGWWAAGALALCGAGFSLATGTFDVLAGIDGPGGRRLPALAITGRHAGLVLGLGLVAPLLAGNLEGARERAALTGAATVLDARLGVTDKIRVARALRDEVERTPKGEMPDLEGPFAGVSGGARVSGELRDRIAAVLTRAFRGGFLVAAALALAAALPALLAGRSPSGARRPGSRPGAAGLAALVVAGGGFLTAELAAGGAGHGRHRDRDPCRTGADPYPGTGLDAVAQRILLGGLDGAACELGTTREELVLSLDGDTGLGARHWDRPTIERAVRSGLVRAVDDAEARGTLPAWAAGPVRSAVTRLPVRQLLSAADWIGTAFGSLQNLDELLDRFRR